jgi:hypothetical protein
VALGTSISYAQETSVSIDNDKKENAIQFEEAVQLKIGDQPVKVEAPGYACPSLADMDGDGHKDLLVGQFMGGKIKVYTNDGKNNFATGEWLKTGKEVAEIPGVW